MAKHKKDIGAFQQAMLSNTKIIGSKSTTEEDNDSTLVITQENYDKILNLSQKYNLMPSELVDVALDMFSSFEEFLFEK